MCRHAPNFWIGNSQLGHSLVPTLSSCGRSSSRCSSPNVAFSSSSCCLALRSAALCSAALCSAAGSHRSHAIGILCGFYVVSLLAKLVGRLSERLEWVGWLSVFNAYEPQRLVSGEPDAWWLLARYDVVLLGIGLAAYVAGGIIFARRDLPAPL